MATLGAPESGLSPIQPVEAAAPALGRPLPDTRGEQVQETAAVPRQLLPRSQPLNQVKPASRDEPAAPAGDLKNLYRLAVERYADIDSYLVRFRRREQVGGKDMPEELMLMKFRKEPWSVYLKWLGSEGKGREVVYVKGRHDDQIHTRLAGGDVPFMPAGKRMALAPDSPLVRARSRHPISDAGIGNLIARFGAALEHVERGDNRLGTLQYLGLVQHPEFSNPLEAVLQVLPPQAETALPRGGRRYWYFDTKLRFPVLVTTQDATGQEVEFYCFDRFLFPSSLSDEEFNPDVLWTEQQQK